jgi:hypothetical protein
MRARFPTSGVAGNCPNVFATDDRGLSLSLFGKEPCNSRGCGQIVANGHNMSEAWRNDPTTRCESKPDPRNLPA